MKATLLYCSAVAVISLCLAAPLLAQISTPSANLTTVGLIPVPGWTTAAGAFDLASFDPANRIMYFADGTNHAVTSVDTVTNTLISSISPPNCTTANCPSGIQVAPDLQKLVVTSRQTTDWIYDLRTPGGPSRRLTVPNGSDELDYDPIHQRVYIANTTAPFFLTGIDLAGPKANTIVAQIPLPGNPEQPRFNVVDGMIYVAIPTVGLIVVDPYCRFGRHWRHRGDTHGRWFWIDPDDRSLRTAGQRHRPRDKSHADRLPRQPERRSGTESKHADDGVISALSHSERCTEIQSE